jgi:hypothetical protein
LKLWYRDFQSPSTVSGEERATVHSKEVSPLAKSFSFSL